MLILTRRSNESLVIGDDVRLTVLGVKGGQVRLGIEAPRDIKITREEITKADEDDDSQPTSDNANRSEAMSADS